MPLMDPNKRPDQLDSPLVRAIIKHGSRANTKLYQWSGGRIGGKWRVGSALHKPAPVCLLTTTGRKSGEKRTVPLLHLVDGDTVVVVASQGGATKNPAWYYNVRADPAVTIQIGSTTRHYVARVANAVERDKLWPRLVELYADFDTYDAWTERTIPVIVCSPR